MRCAKVMSTVTENKIFFYVTYAVDWIIDTFSSCQIQNTAESNMLLSK